MGRGLLIQKASLEKTKGKPMTDRLKAAQAHCEAGMRRVATTPEPKGQKFPCGSRVRIADDLGECMRHFQSGVEATVHHTYAHAFGGDDVKSYSLILEGRGMVAWYSEEQLTAIADDFHRKANP